MYALYCFLIWALVYTLPSLAFFPRLIAPQTAFAIPILSTFIVYVVASILIFFNMFNHASVCMTAFLFAVMALYRLKPTVGKSLGWTKQATFFYLFHFILLLPYMVKLGTHAFERGDEIYSWNFWAIQHYFVESIDFSHTGAPYPQLFPKLLAFCYHLLDNLDLQLPVKATLIIFPWSMLNAIAMTRRYESAGDFLSYGLLLLFVLAGVGLEQFFNDGYADPLMTSSLVVSAVLLWQSQQAHSEKASTLYYPFFSVICGLTAAYSKQPALLWVLLALPVSILFFSPNRQSTRWLWVVLSFMGGLFWLMGEGRQFHHNHGVLSLSFADRDLVSQLLYAMDKYWLHQPLLLLLFLLASVACTRQKLLISWMVFFIVPGTLCWFLFGAYQLRLGQHLIAMAFLILVASGWSLPKVGWLARPDIRYRPWLATLSIVSIAVSLFLGVKTIHWERPGLSLYAGGRQALQRYFGKDSDLIYTTIYQDPQAVLWVPSRYLYGLFYRHTQLVSPNYRQHSPYDAAALVKELQHTQPDYVFTVSPYIVDGPASDLLATLIEACPTAFHKISDAENRFSFVTYGVDKKALLHDACLMGQV